MLPERYWILLKLSCWVCRLGGAMGRVFISYSHADKLYAERVIRQLRSARFDVVVDQDALQAGQEWRTELFRLIRSSQAILVILTESARTSEEVASEWAYALGVGVPVFPLRFEVTSRPSRLDQLHGFDFRRHSAPWGDLIKTLNFLPPAPQEFTEGLEEVQSTAQQIRANLDFQSNRCFQHIVSQSLREMGSQLQSIGTGSQYMVPATQYPFYLISAQNVLRARVKALALVDQEELFWQQGVGRVINESAQPESVRVFAFTSSGDFHRMFETLTYYAAIYRVYAISYEHLVAKFSAFGRDFSIIEADGDRVLGSYAGPVGEKVIRFSADVDEVIDHERALDRIVAVARPIAPDDRGKVVAASKQIFEDWKLSPLMLKTAEMSLYIAIDDYDEFEERHAYYVEMMAEMLAVFRARRGRRYSRDHERCQALELGAGTGIFTRRLANEPDVECVAVEIDFACSNKLERNLRAQSNAVAVNADSRTYREGGDDGRFQFIFSSFADHHIKLEDKSRYFENIKNNLAPGGRIIIGDEFLPEYDPNDEEAWQAALRGYHGHIIEFAAARAAEHESRGEEEQARAHRELIKLESAALESGLAKQGDFKLSRSLYEQILKEQGLKFRAKKIGPLDDDSVGGIYVYELWLD
ncbi:TIR domain-containing protein [Streptomyces sp. NBC_00879]|uniref:TIR domain-containing protein n=1 Tax=Streptomyces sp. NBC_00879 TaxID=2975855 RepID=UPI00386961E3